MPLEGEELGVELVDLRHAGLIGLPRIAEAYVDANRTLAGTSNGDGAFGRGYGGPSYAYGTSSGKVYGPWTALRDTIQTILGNTAANVVVAGGILCHIADTYAATDADAAEVLQREWEDREVDPTNPKDRPLVTDLPEPEFP